MVTDTSIYFGVEVKEMPPKCSGWGMVFSPVRSNWEEEAEIKDKKSMEQRNLDRMKIEASSLKGFIILIFLYFLFKKNIKH